MTRRVRLLDVAVKAGVSPAAASLALNGNAEGNLAPATRDRILAAAEELNYTPNFLAQSLRRQKTQVLGVMTDGIATSPFAGRLLAGALDEATRRGYVLFVADSQNHRGREERAMREFGRRRVDGLIYATMGLQFLAELPTSELPLVLANCWAGEDDGVCVIPDDARAGRAAADYLIGLGHGRIAMIAGAGAGSGRPGRAAGPVRRQAFTSQAGAAGVTPTIQPIGPHWTIRAGHEAAMRLLTDDAGALLPASSRPTAIWGVNDRVATGVLLAALRLGLDVPRDLSVMGMDDQEELADCVVPALTTLALPHFRIGQEAVSLLLDLIGGLGDVVPGVRRLECPLVERASTAPAAGS